MTPLSSSYENTSIWKNTVFFRVYSNSRHFYSFKGLRSWKKSSNQNDESFLDVIDSVWLFGTLDLAKMIKIDVFKQAGFYITIGIGDNPLLVKFSLDLESKNNADMKAEWRYENVQNKLRSVTCWA